MSGPPDLLATPSPGAPPLMRGAVALAQLAAEKAGIIPEHVAQWQLREIDPSDFLSIGWTVDFVLRPAPDWDVRSVDLTERDLAAAGVDT